MCGICDMENEAPFARDPHAMWFAGFLIGCGLGTESRDDEEYELDLCKHHEDLFSRVSEWFEKECKVVIDRAH